MTLLATIFLTLGFILIISDIFVFTRAKVEQAVSETRFDDKSSFLLSLEELALKKTKISEDKAAEVENALLLMGIEVTASTYLSEIIAKSILYFILFGVFALILQSFTLLIMSLFLCLYYVFLKYKNIYKLSDEIRTNLEKELPKLCSVISSNLNHTNNVENILKSYLPIASSLMANQIEFTLADISTSNVSDALIRLDDRLHSPMISDVIRGLISVSNGDDQRIYFGTKAEEFRRKYKQIILLQVQKRPSKLLPMQLVIGVFFIGILIYPLMIYFGQTISSVLY